jgi:dipeptidyl aminopeptidase/acylaminoacyl peptidase
MKTTNLIKTLLIAGVTVIAFSGSGNAQQANFELAERFTTQKMDKLIGSTNVFPRWIDDSDDFWYEFENTEGTFWYYVDTDRRSQRLLFDQEELAGKLSEEFKRPFNSKELDLKGFEYDTDRELFTFHVDSIEFTYEVDGSRLIKGDSLEPKKREPWKSYSPDSTWIAYAKNHNLFLMSSDTSDTTEIQLTTDGKRWFSYAWNQGDTSTTEKMRARVNWFDDETKLFVERSDMRKVDELWVINMLGKRPELETYKYAMPGEEEVGIEYVEVIDIASREKVVIQAEKWEDQSLNADPGNLQRGYYRPNSSDFLYLTRLNRKADKVELLKADTETGEVEVIFDEESQPYWNWRFMDVSIIDEGEQYIWWSERTGWGQFYRYDSEGNLMNQITSGNFVAGSIEKIDTTAQKIFFTGYGREQGQHPYYANLYSVNFNGSNFKHLTPEDANHRIFASDEGNYFVDNISTVDQPTRAVLRDGTGRIILELQQVDISRATEIGWDVPEEFVVKAADGYTDLYGVMWKPFDFDPSKKYPIISYVYPGPQTEPFPVTFGPSRHQTLAQLGFIVVAFGQRGGSPLRSRYYHTFGYGDLRDYPLADNRYGLEQLIGRHSFIDGENVGIYGHSGGGFMSTAALLTHPDFYDVAVSSAGNHDNNVYNRWWSETHNGVKETVKTVTEMGEDSVEVEKEVSTFDGPIEKNADLVENLQGHLLLVHGNVDNNVHPANTIRLVDALIKAGKRFDMMILPGRRHGFGPYSSYFERMYWHYFAEHLLGDYRTNVDYNIPEDD